MKRRLFEALGAVALLTVVSLAACEPGPTTYSWMFVRDPADRLDSRLYWRPGTYGIRAGSGQNTNECSEWQSNVAGSGGWLPAGEYTTVQRFVKTYGANDVRGPVVFIDRKKCSDGVTWRDELFIHSSYTWTEPRYASVGCIKVMNTGYTGAYNSPQNVTGHIAEVYDRSDALTTKVWVLNKGGYF